MGKWVQILSSNRRLGTKGKQTDLLNKQTKRAIHDVAEISKF